MKRYPIFFSFDNCFVIPAAVTFESLLTNAGEEVSYDLFVLHEDVSLESQGLLSELVKRHGRATLRFIDVKATFERLAVRFDERNFNLGVGQCTFTKETLFRCLPTLIEEFDAYETILYSDVDICVVDDISEIFETEMGDDYIAGCRLPKALDAQVVHLPPRLRPHYVAGGIWLMNLRQMRKDDLAARIIGIMRDPPFRLIWNDQDIMNLACDTRVTFLSYRYCSIPRWKTEFRPTGYRDEYYPSGELREALFRPKIVHYAANKPWDGPCDDDELWHFWHGQTGFPAMKVRRDKSENVQAYLFKYLKLPRQSVRAQFRRGELEIKIMGFVLRIRIKKIAEQ